MNLADYLVRGKLVIEKVTGGTNFSDSTSLHKETVPTGHRWLLIGGVVYRDNNATIKVTLVPDGSNGAFKFLDESAAATTENAFPVSGSNSKIDGGAFPIPIPAGGIIQFAFGAAQGAAAYTVIYYVDVVDT